MGAREFFFSGSAAVVAGHLECATLGNRAPVGISAVGSRRVTQSVRNARDLLREPLRHASNLGGPFRLRSLLPAVSLGPPEGATTHYLYLQIRWVADI